MWLGQRVTRARSLTRMRGLPPDSGGRCCPPALSLRMETFWVLVGTALLWPGGPMGAVWSGVQGLERMAAWTPLW